MDVGAESTGWRERIPRVKAPQLTFKDRLRLVRGRWRTLLRLGCATAGAYAISTYLLGHEQAFFAPVAAVVVLLAGAGLRGRLLMEVIFGVAFGVLVGELLVLGIGRGVWQLALIVLITAAASVFAGIKGVALTQATNSAVLLASVVPAVGSGNPAISRFTDALVGGLCALTMTLLLPRNAIRDIDHEVRPLLTRLEHILESVATAMRTTEPAEADAALASARGLQGRVNTAMSTAANVAEIAALSPWRWRQRDTVNHYAAVLADIDNAIRDARVLARRAASMLRLGEVPADELTTSVELLARGVHLYEGELSSGAVESAQEELVDAVRLAVNSQAEQITMNSAAVASQVRSLAADILLASGMTRDELDVRLNF